MGETATKVMSAEEMLAVIDLGMETIARLQMQRAILVAGLQQVAKGEGAFSRDPLTHAENCIAEMKATALSAVAAAASLREP